MRERTRQQFDPVGSAESRSLWVLLAAGAAVYAVVMVVVDWPFDGNPALAAVGAGLSAAAAVLVIVWTTPSRSRFTRQRHLAVHTVALAALAASVWARHGSEFDLGAGFTSTVIAGLIVAMSPYRPPAELVAVGVSTGLIAGFILLTAVQSTNPTLPALVLVIVGVTPIIVITVGAATYTETILRSIENAEHVRSAAPSPAADPVAQRDRVTVMTQDAIPLLQRVLDASSVTSGDRSDAAAAAESLRAMLVAEVNRTWLDASQGVGDGPRFTVTDPGSLARDLPAYRRTVLRALLAALGNEPGFTGGSITITGHPTDNRITIDASYDATEYMTPPGHPLVSALLAVMRSVFTEHESSRSQTRVLVIFGYGRE